MKWTIHDILVFISVVAILIVIGCECRVDTRPTPPTPTVKDSIKIDSSIGNRLFLVEVGGHRFAVLDFAGHVAMCEVTHASSIKLEEEK